MEKAFAKALITLCVDEGRKQGVIKEGEVQELLDYLDEISVSGDAISGSSEIPNRLNELADYARRQVEELLFVIKKYNDYSEEQIEELRTHLMAMFLEGAGWQKKQMLKEAVEGEFMLNSYPIICLDDCKDYDFKDGDKVKLIIISDNGRR